MKHRNQRGSNSNLPARPGFCEQIGTLVCSSVFWVFLVRTFTLVSLYFLFSVSLTFFQKWFIKDFHFPLTVVICHLTLKFVISGIIRSIMECCTKKDRIILPWGIFFRRICLIGFASGLDIGLSNWSFEYITVSLYSMSKSSCIIFILLFSFLFGLETLRLSLLFVVFLIAGGLFLFTYHSTQFNLVGFIMIMTASLTSGLRWTLAQVVMQRKEIGLGNPIDMVYHMQPWMIIGILPLAVYFEGLSLATTDLTFRYTDSSTALTTVSLIALGGTLAFLMEVSEFLLLSNTSSLTLAIAGILKEVIILYMGINVNKDSVTTTNLIGLSVTLIGITLHVFLRAYQSQERRRADEGWEMLGVPLLPADGVTEDEEEEDVLYEASR